MKKTVLILIFCMGAAAAGTLHVATAANMSYAMEALKAAFEKHTPQTHIEVMIGGSGKLAAQIRQGAPYDLFLSANMRYPQKLYEMGVAAEKPVMYAQGALVLLSKKPRPYEKGLALLASGAIHKIAVANPKTAPYGVAAEEALRKAGLYERVKPKFVYGESISQTITYTLRAADIGMVAKSALFAPQMRHFTKGEYWMDVDSALYTPIAQGMVLLKRAAGNREAKMFYDFMLSDEAKTILRTYGYRLP
jgi:molybdate transport system substrate-binding protein